MAKVLIIEDDQFLNKAYGDKLQSKYVLSFALDGFEGWEKALKEKPDLIVLDVILPGGMNGFEVLAKLKDDERTRDIPIIILTNLGEDERSNAIEKGAVDFLIKANVSLDDIMKTIDKHLEKKANG